MSTNAQLGFVAAIFALFAFGYYYMFEATNDADQEYCRLRCSADGRGFVYAPHGTTGRYIDGSRNSTDEKNQCACTSHSASSQVNR